MARFVLTLDLKGDDTYDVACQIEEALQSVVDGYCVEDYEEILRGTPYIVQDRAGFRLGEIVGSINPAMDEVRR